MPGMVDEGREILNFPASEVSGYTYVNVIGQYRPHYRSGHLAEIHRPTDRSEAEDLRQRARLLGRRLAE